MGEAIRDSSRMSVRGSSETGRRVECQLNDFSKNRKYFSHATASPHKQNHQLPVSRRDKGHVHTIGTVFILVKVAKVLETG
jgi:hypothetical protein